MVHAVILGAGITGVTTAYQLLQKGFQVTVLDRQRYPAMETSFANGGQLSVSNAEVWNQLSTFFKGLKWLMRKDAPLLLNPAPSWHKYSWLAEFAAQMRNYRGNTIETVRLALAAREHLFGMAEKEGIDFDLERRGILHIYHSAQDFATAKRVNELLVQGGLERYAVTPQEIQTIEPALRGQYHAGFYTPSDATGDIHKFTCGLAKACERLGASFINNAEITHMQAHEQGVRLQWRDHYAASGQACHHELQADTVVVCAGVGSRALAAQVGDRINVYPVKGYSITVHLDEASDRSAAPYVSLLDESAKIVTSRLGADRLRIAGTAEFNGMNRDIRHDRIQPLINWVHANFDLCTERVVPWAGLRPMTPSMLPRVGAGRQSRVYYNTGHGHLGWTLSGATAAAVAQMMSERYSI